MKFEWDENKNQSNIEKHSIDFEDAKDIFKDKKKKKAPNLRHNYGESRWLVIGKVVDRIMVVVYTMRDTAFRIISARYAKKKERDIYKDQEF